MARFFTEQDIDRFRDCFYLNCKSGVITDVEQLKFVMLSVGMSPTNDELRNYLSIKNKKISFADFLDVSHSHRQVERVPDEILKAFAASNWLTGVRGPKDKSMVHVSSLQHVLCNWGPEPVTKREFNALLREFNVDTSNNRLVDYRQFVQSLSNHSGLAGDA